ncbi:hypothetical protein, partial [Algoriphagus marinus]|uniref:hypothetical protein n=1 Tax=Algoriphagus marinus TaxID=1925762 RepID=UPI000B259872
IYFGLFLQNKENITTRNREIIISFIDQIEAKVLNHKEVSCSDKFNLISINSNNKNINYLIAKIPILLEKTKSNNSLIEIEEIKKQLKEIHKLLTFYKEEDVLENNYLIENNIVILGIDRKNMVESIFSDLLFNIVCIKIHLSKL